MVAFDELPSDRFLAGGDSSGALIAFVGDDLVGVDVVVDVVVVPGGLVMDRAGERVGDPQHVAVGVGGDLMVVSGGAVLAGVQLWVGTVGPAGSQSAVEDQHQLLWEVFEGRDVLAEGSLDRSFECSDGSRHGRLGDPEQFRDGGLGQIAAKVEQHHADSCGQIETRRAASTGSVGGTASSKPCDQFGCLCIGQSCDSVHSRNGPSLWRSLTSPSVIGGPLRYGCSGRDLCHTAAVGVTACGGLECVSEILLRAPF